MHPDLQRAQTLYRSHQEILCKSEVIRCSNLTGAIDGMYPLLNQCRVVLRGQEGTDHGDPTLRRWIYDVTMPMMLVGKEGAQRSNVHLMATLYTPFSEEKMRYGCQLQCDCDVYPRCASELEPGVYRLTYDAHVSLYSTQLRAG